MRKSKHNEPVKAVTVFSYVKANKLLYFKTCADCEPGLEEILKNNKNVNQLAKGPICPICSGTGFLPYLRHVARGQCFRCKGKGHW